MPARLFIAAGLFLAIVPPVRADVTFTFEKVVDTDTVVPASSGNATGTFDWMRPPVMSGGNIVFHADVNDINNVIREGIYALIDGEFIVVADKNTPLYSADDYAMWNIYEQPFIEGNQVVFDTWGLTWDIEEEERLYQFDDGELTEIVSSQTPIPGGSGNFSIFGPPLLDNGCVYFRGFGLSGQQGFYRLCDSDLSMLVDRNTPNPSGSGTLSTMASLSVSEGNLAFVAKPSVSGAVYGIYSTIGGLLGLVADENTQVPGTNNTFTSGFASLSIDHELIIFNSSGGQQEGIYAFANNALVVIADRDTHIPGSFGEFQTFWEISQSSGAALFLAEGDFERDDGFYISRGGQILPVLLRDAVLDGRVLNGLGLDTQGLDGNQFAFLVGFTDESLAVYIGTIHVTCTPGDLDGDGQITHLDAPALIDVLLHPLFATFDETCAADVNEDGTIDGRDIQAFLDLLAPN